MPWSGSHHVAVATHFVTMRFNWEVTSQSIANNTSTVAWKLLLETTTDGHINSTASKDWSVTINGTTYKDTNTVGIADNDTKTLASGNVTIAHNADGSKTFNYSATQEFDITFSGSHIGSRSITGSAILPTISRASQPSCVTWPDHTQNVGEFGDTISIHMNRNSSDFTHTVRYQFGTSSGTIATGVGTGTTWTIPLSLMNLLPTALKGSGTIYVDTYNGKTLVGTKYCGFTATVPASIKPTVSMKLEDVSGVGTTYGSPVQGLSKIKVTVNTTEAYSSPIAAYAISIDGLNYSAAEFTTKALSKSGDSPVTVEVTDGRGRSATTSYTMKVQAYARPNISLLTVHRCDEDGTENEQGEYVKATFAATITSLSSKNTAAYKLRYKKSTDTSYTEITLANLANAYTVSGASYIFEADSNHSYDIELAASDRHYTTVRSTSASTAFMLMNFSADGRSIGLLKAAEKAGAIDVGGDMYLEGHALYGAHGIVDTRDKNESPAWYMATHGRGVVWEFKELTVVGFTAPSSKYGPMQTIIPWKDSSGGLPRQVVYEGRTRWTRIANSAEAWGAWVSDAPDPLIAYPVGSIYIAYNHTNPGTLFGGTWERITNAFLWGTTSGGVIGQTGGASEVTLTVNQIPAHSHGATYTGDAKDKKYTWHAQGTTNMGYEAISTGGGQPHNNMPPYIQVSIWRRTA